VSEHLGESAPKLFACELRRMVTRLGIENPTDQVEEFTIVNETKETKAARKQLAKQFDMLYKQSVSSPDFYATLLPFLKFVYNVRCNLFHGVKTSVQMFDHSQQTRLLVYSTVLIASNSLLFQVAETSDIGWSTVKVNFDSRSKIG